MLQIWVTLDLLRYSAQVCTEICDHLNIQLFRIPIVDHHHLYQNQRSGSVQGASEKNGTTITTRSQSRRLSKKH